MQYVKTYVKLKITVVAKNANLYIQFLQYIAITTFETETSNFFAIDFSKTSLAKEPYYPKMNILYFIGGFAIDYQLDVINR